MQRVDLNVNTEDIYLKKVYNAFQPTVIIVQNHVLALIYCNWLIYRYIK